MAIPPSPIVAKPPWKPARTCPGDGADLGDVLDDAVADEQDVGYDEDDEDRRQHGHRFLDAAQVDDDEKDDGHDLERDLERLVGRREEAEDGVTAGDDGDGDRQHVVDEQGRSGDDAGLLAQGVGGDDVAAASGREILDDARVGVGDDEDRQGRGQGQEDGQVGVLAQDLESLFRAVGGGREAVGAEADPGQDRDQGELVEEGRILDVAGLPDQGPPDLPADACRFRLSYICLEGVDMRFLGVFRIMRRWGVL